MVQTSPRALDGAAPTELLETALRFSPVGLSIPSKKSPYMWQSQQSLQKVTAGVQSAVHLDHSTTKINCMICCCVSAGIDFVLTFWSFWGAIHGGGPYWVLMLLEVCVQTDDKIRICSMLRLFISSEEGYGFFVGLFSSWVALSSFPSWRRRIIWCAFDVNGQV